MAFFKRAEAVDGEAVKNLLIAYYAPGQGPSAAMVAAMLRKCSPDQRRLLRGSVPFSTGLTGDRCNQLRDLFAEIEKEK